MKIGFTIATAVLTTFMCTMMFLVTHWYFAIPLAFGIILCVLLSSIATDVY